MIEQTEFINQPKPDAEGIDIPNETNNLVFNIKEEENGKHLGTIRGSVIKLHKMFIQARLEVDPSEDCIPTFQKLLEEEYRIPVKYDAAYMILDYVVEAFNLKKNNINF